MRVIAAHTMPWVSQSIQIPAIHGKDKQHINIPVIKPKKPSVS